VETVIEAGRADGQYWQDLWRYRELFLFLAWREIVVRYKQTAIGIAWCIVRPLIAMVVFTFVFGRLANLPSDGVPYPLLVYTAMLPWQFFATSVSEGTNSLIGNTSLISKVYFPRVLMPASVIMVSLVDFLISFIFLVCLMVWYQVVPTWHILAMPLLLLVAASSSLGMGLWFAALNVRYRDFRYIVPVLLQVGIYLSPIGFTSNLVPPDWRFLYSLNPMVGVIDGFRWSMLGGGPGLYWPGLVAAVALSLLLITCGFFYFRKTERTFADVV